MVLFVILLVFIALLAYTLGSVNTLIFAGRNIFHRSLYAYPFNNRGLTLFFKDAKRKELILLAVSEIVRVGFPVLVGGWIMSSYDMPELGRAFAMFCLLMGQAFPLVYGFKGLPVTVAFLVATVFVNIGLGLFCIVIFFAVYFVTRYISLSIIVAAFAAFVLSIIAIDAPLVTRMFLACAAIVLIDKRKNIVRLFKGKEPKFRYRKDISYMFDK